VAATIPNRRKRRSAGGPWSLVLLALLLAFWKFVGGAGGWFPGSGAGDDRKDRGDSRPAASRAETRGTTVRQALMDSTLGGSSSPARPVRGAATSLKARVKVTPARDPARAGGHDVTVSVMKDGRALDVPARVELVPASQPGPPDGRPVAAQTTADGRATMAAPSGAGKIRVRVIADGQPAVSGEIAVREGEIDVDLTGHASVVGRARFADGTAAGDQDLLARLFRAGQPDERRDLATDSEGAFRFEAPAGRHVLLELLPHDSVKGADIAPLVFDRPALEPGSTWDLGTVTFQRELVLAEGVVQDKNGAGVPKASVIALPTQNSKRALAARTDEAGRFVIKGPPEIEAFEVFASTENEAASVAGAPPKRGAADLKLVLAPAGRIEGAVRSPAAQLNALLRVELLTGQENLFLSTHVNPEGTFEFPHVPAGQHWKVSVVGPDGRSPAPRAITVPEGGASTDASLKAIAVETQLAPARLRVIDSSGAPVPDARVEVELTADARLRARTDKDGVAEVLYAPRPDGDVVVAVEAAGFQARRGPWDGRSAVTLQRGRPESAESR
jgi:hypothetical protein